MWIYTYLRPDLREKNAGPFNDKTEAETARIRHISLGEICDEPVEKPDDYKLRKSPAD